MVTSFRVEYTKDALKQLKKMDRFDAHLILSWIEKNLSGTDNPRRHGKGLTANRTGEWRYRVGSYRILAQIYDDVLLIEIFAIGHRRAVYGP
ncbi:type II toxin-antitoxin system RelE/ParE family toxin [Trueperella pyogenes]|nr:type II toxin-antitoxin system RelE/ParE family toxin [Trueperella pyogenes]MDF2419676.1 type II toxin-antitoxin system RelE/ParE family toxin [Trueperella pyogenes]QTG76471.1 type II toxin-antitoxin system RelE/ParE family toxin [Trueperella pecoris]WHU60092.1 type II toxin-antitoxin system RelE/ParE family toxin [Trueperella pyogenes]WHU62132.1 type II toxin-antitoxin system RelE/ParE family toxin [Trueperella pyogenes]